MKKTIDRARELAFLVFACADTLDEAKAIAQLRKAIELKKLRTGAEVKKEFVQILTRILKVQDTMLLLTTQPSVVLVVGVNGVGKTTTIGKLAAQLKKEGNRVRLHSGGEGPRHGRCHHRHRRPPAQQNKPHERAQ